VVGVLDRAPGIGRLNWRTVLRPFCMAHSVVSKNRRHSMAAFTTVMATRRFGVAVAAPIHSPGGGSPTEAMITIAYYGSLIVAFYRATQ